MTVTIGRRELLVALGGGAAAWPLAARAQQPKMLRVGYSGILPRGAPHYAAFERRMAELGYQPGRNFTFEYIQAPSIEGYELTYRELAALKVDILLAAGNEPALRAARSAAGATPTVFIALDFDPVEKGYVASLSRPGSNSTGLFVSQLELAGKRVELLRFNAFSSCKACRGHQIKKNLCVRQITRSSANGHAHRPLGRRRCRHTKGPDIFRTNASCSDQWRWCRKYQRQLSCPGKLASSIERA